MVTEHEQGGTVRLSQAVFALEHGGSECELIRKSTFRVVRNSKGDGGSYWGNLLGVSDTQRSVRQTVVANLKDCMTVKYSRNLPK